MTPTTMMRQGARLALGLTLLFGATSCEESHHEEGGHHQTGNYPATHPMRQDTELTREYVAQIRAIQHIELRAMEHGYLDDIFIDEGQWVTKGEKMFQIMPRVYQAEAKKAAAEAEFADIEYRNTKTLQEGNVVSPNELLMAKAKLDQANAERDLANVHLGLTELKAPFDGIMGRLEVRRGSLLEEGELLTTLSDNSEMWVYFNVSEAEYLDYKTQIIEDEEPLQVQLRMANHKIFDEIGEVRTIEADFNNETGNIAFRATFPNPKGLLRHGETGKVLVKNTIAGALVVPQKATFDVLDKKYVFVIGEDGVVQRKEITVQAELPHLYVIESGVTEEDVILLEGLRHVRDGQHVEVHIEKPDEVVAQLHALHAE